jgi:hypothetical protein
MGWIGFSGPPVGRVKNFLGFEEGLDGLVESDGLVVHDEVAGVVDADDLEVGLGGIGVCVESGNLCGGAFSSFIGIEEGHGRLDTGKLWTEVGGKVFEHCIDEDGAVGGDGGGRNGFDAVGRFGEAGGEERLGGGELVVWHLEHLVAHDLGLRGDVFYRGSGAEDQSIEGKCVDDEELADVFGMGLGEHESEQAPEGVADDGHLLDVVIDDVLVELLDDWSKDGAGGVGASGLTSETCDLDEVQAVAGNEQLCLGGVDIARTGEARDEDDFGAFAGSCAFYDDGEAGGGSGDGLAEERLSQQHDAGEEKEEGDNAECCTGCGHG